MQAKLLRVIETREVLRVGALKPRPIDVRFIAATNRDLEEEVARGAFRQDLYYRLNGVSLVIPPLRERRTEIGPLRAVVSRRRGRQLGADAAGAGPAALALLQGYAWPGNVRELRNMMERAVLLALGDEITPAELPFEDLARTCSRAANLRAVPEAAAASSALDAPKPADYDRIVESLARCNGNQTRAARWLGMPRRTFCARLKAYGIPRPRSGA